MRKVKNCTYFMGILTCMACALAIPRLGHGQLPSSSTKALGTANNYTALARGYSAVALNPANLALPGNPKFSLSLAPVQVKSGVGPIGLGSIADYEGKAIPTSTKLSWMRQIEDAGGLTGSGGAQTSALAFNIHRFGFQICTVGDVEAHLNPDAAELILFGNAGRTGIPRDFQLGDSRIDGFAATTFAMSYAAPLNIELGFPGALFAVGATVKYTVGHALILARNAESLVTSDPLLVDMKFPVIAPDTDSDWFDRGHGFGLDVGAAWQWERWTAGVTIQNLIQTFNWDIENLTYRPGNAFFSEDESSSDFDERPAVEAPSSLHDAVDKRDFDTRLSAGVAYCLTDKLTVTGDLRHQLGDGLRSEERTHLGAGAEYLPTAVVPLRAGMALVSGGFQLASGAGLVLGPVNLSGAILFQFGDDDLTSGMVALSYGGH